MGKTRAPGLVTQLEIRYINPITGVASSSTTYIDEQGIKKSITSNKYKEYNIDGKWVKPNLVPHIRERLKKALNSKNGYFCAKLIGMSKKEKHRKKQGRHLQGENEFKDDRWGRCDKLMAHFDKQVKRYGNKCPMTHIPFTMDRAFERFDINNYNGGVYSNVSPDRIFNHIDYTEQNLIFTSQLWNFKKGGSSLYELSLILQPEVLERYKAIVMERFPDQEYVL